MSLRICKPYGSFGVNEDANAAPWPDVNSAQVAGNEQIILGSLPEDTRELVASCATFRIMASAERPVDTFFEADIICAYYRCSSSRRVPLHWRKSFSKRFW